MLAIFALAAPILALGCGQKKPATAPNVAPPSKSMTSEASGPAGDKNSKLGPAPEPINSKIVLPPPAADPSKDEKETPSDK